MNKKLQARLSGSFVRATRIKPVSDEEAKAAARFDYDMRRPYRDDLVRDWKAWMVGVVGAEYPSDAAVIAAAVSDIKDLDALFVGR